jgi:hypothetical protein
MNRSFVSNLVAIAYVSGLLIATPVLADCENPKASEIPDGKSATKEQMLAAIQNFKQYNADVVAYIDCLNAETKAKISEGSIPSGQIMQFKSMQTRKQSSASDELKAKADSFNEQVRAYKARGG